MGFWYMDFLSFTKKYHERTPNPQNLCWYKKKEWTDKGRYTRAAHNIWWDIELYKQKESKTYIASSPVMWEENIFMGL